MSVTGSVDGHTGGGGRVWVQLIATYIGNIIIPTGYFMNGVIYVALLEYYGDTPVKTSLVVSVNSALLCILGPFAGTLINLSSCRVVMVAGGLVMAFACFVSAFVNSVEWLIVIYGFIGGAGNSLAGIPVAIVLGFCFTKHRDIVMSFSTVMIGIGMLISSPFGLYLIASYGVNGTFIILSGMYLNMSIIGLLLKPSDVEKRIKKQRKLAVLEQVSRGSTSRNNGTFKKVKEWIRSKAFLFFDAPFVLFLFSTLSWNLMIAVCQMHLPNYMTTRGADSTQIASLMVCFGISNTIGRLTGTLSLTNTRTVDPLKLHIIVIGLSGTATVTFPAYKEMVYSEYILASIAGLMTGYPNAVMSPLTIRFVGVKNLSLAFGFIYLSSGFGFITGPPISSALYSSTGSYDSSFVFAGLVNIAGSLSALLSLFLLKRKRVQDQSQAITDPTEELVNIKTNTYTSEDV